MPSGSDSHVVAESSGGHKKAAAPAPRAVEVKSTLRVAKPAPAAEMDLLGGFDDASFGGSASSSQTNQGGGGGAGAQFDPFGDNFSAPTTPNSPWSSAVAASSPAAFAAPAAPVASAPLHIAPPRNVSNEDIFASFGSAPAATGGHPGGGGFDMFSSQNNSPVPSHSNSVSDFGGLLTPHSQSVSPIPPAAAAGGGVDPFGNDDLTLLQPARTNNNSNGFNGGGGGGMSGAQTWHNSPARGGGVGFGSMITSASNSSNNSFNSLGGLPPAPQQMRSTSAPMSMMNSNGGSGGMSNAGGYGMNSSMGSGYRPGGGQSPMMMGGAGGVMMGGARPTGAMGGGGGASAISNINNFASNSGSYNGGGGAANKTTNSFDFVQSAMNHHLGSASPGPSAAPTTAGIGSYANNNNGRFNAMGGSAGMGYQPQQQQYRANPPPNPFAK